MGIYTLFSILILMACILLILIVLVQNSKGGGLAANFTSTGQSMGVRKTADFLEKATWTLAVCLLLFSLLSSATIPRGEDANRSIIEEQIDNAIDPTAIPTLPTANPEQQDPAQGGE